MEVNVTPLSHRSGRRNKTHSKHDHKCHKAKHKSTEFLLEKRDPTRKENYFPSEKGPRNAMSVDSGLSQTEIFFPVEINLAAVCHHLRGENEKLRNEIEKLVQENEEIKKRNLNLKEENENVKEDVLLMKNLVYKLNLELEKYQNGDKRKLDEIKLEALPQNYNKNFLRPVLPLLKAYSEALNEKDDIIRNLESEYKNFISSFNNLLQENDKLYVELEKKIISSDGGAFNQVKQLSKYLEIAKQENNVLMQQIKLEKEKFMKFHSVFKVKVKEALQEKDTTNKILEECKAELYVLKGKHAVLKQEFERLKLDSESRVPLAVHSASINECSKLFQDLKNEYENEKYRLNAKIREQEAVVVKQNKLEKEWSEEKDFLEKSNFNQTFEIESLKRKIFELENELKEEDGRSLTNEKNRKELIESKKQLRDSRAKVEELSNKLATTKRQLQKAMTFAEDIVRGQESLLIQLHTKQKENNYMTSQFGSLKNHLKEVKREAQQGLISVEEKIKDLEAENYALEARNRKVEKLLEEKNQTIKNLEPTKDF